MLQRNNASRHTQNNRRNQVSLCVEVILFLSGSSFEYLLTSFVLSPHFFEISYHPISFLVVVESNLYLLPLRSDPILDVTAPFTVTLFPRITSKSRAFMTLETPVRSAMINNDFMARTQTVINI